MIGDYFIIDVVLLLFLVMGAIIGFKYGAIKTTAKIIGTFGAIIIAYYIKNPLSVILYSNLPFFSFKGLLSGVSVLNIFIYEAIAYLIVFLILYFIFKGIIFFSGIIEKLFKATIILGLVSKIIGIFVGLVYAYLFIFILCFAYQKVSLICETGYESKYSNKVLTDTPILSKMINKNQQNIDEIISLKDKYEKIDSKTEFNTEALVILLKNRAITKTSAEKLIDNKKIKVNINNSELRKYLNLEEKW